MNGYYYDTNKIKIRVYLDCVKLMKSCRNKSKGKPLSSAFRLHDYADGAYVISVHGKSVCRITPDDKLEFLEGDYTGNAQTLSQSLLGITPVMWNRVGTGRWRVAHMACKAMSDIRANRNDRGIVDSRYDKISRDQHWEYLNKYAPEFFPGIAFSLVTGECLNRRPDFKHSINPEAKKLWLRKVKAFKRMIRVQTKLGVWETLILRGLSAEYPPQIDEVMRCMDTGIMSESLQREFASYIANKNRWGAGSRWENADGHIDNWFNNNSIAMRRSYGVFEGEVK